MRSFAHVAVNLLIGAMVTVLVAWGCALASPYFETNNPRGGGGAGTAPDFRWTAISIPYPGGLVVDAHYWPPFPPPRTAPAEGYTTPSVFAPSGFELAAPPASAAPPSAQGVERSVAGWGWPWLALTCEVFPIATSGPTPPPRARTGGDAITPAGWLTGAAGPTRTQLLPLHVRASGFVADSLIYAAASSCVALACRAAIRARRRARSRCPSCNYPLRGAAHCPECGELTRTIS